MKIPNVVSCSIQNLVYGTLARLGLLENYVNKQSLMRHMMLAYYIFNFLLNFDTTESSATLLFKLAMPTTASRATLAATGDRQVQI
jgi:hypothetical protein